MPSYDANLQWGGALKLNASGDIALVSGSTYAQQRIIRRLFTGPAVLNAAGQVTQIGDYPFHPNYGAGLGREVDTPNTNQAMKVRQQKVKKALSQEPIVDQSVPPQITFTNTDRAQLITVQYQTTDKQIQKFTARV